MATLSLIDQRDEHNVAHLRPTSANLDAIALHCLQTLPERMTATSLILSQVPSIKMRSPWPRPWATTASLKPKKQVNMPSMVDPHIGLVSYQAALVQGLIHPIPCKLHRDLTVLFDDAPDGKRITYALMTGSTVKAMVIYTPNGSADEKPYFQVGYAVAKAFRMQGIAKRALQMSLEEITEGFRASIPSFYIEAVVSRSNTASLRIAEAVIGGLPEEIIDQHSGENSLRYTTSVGT